MPMHELAGQKAPVELLEDIPSLVSDYYTNCPDPSQPNQLVRFGTSGHRGCSKNNTFNDDHIAAICQAICEFRKKNDITGPLFLGKDTHALSEPAFRTAIEVFAANSVQVRYQSGLGYTPTPVISHAIICHNRGRTDGLADGVVITPSHNPPCDGGFKYNSTNGGPADTEITSAIQDRANQLLDEGVDDSSVVKRTCYERAIHSSSIESYDYVKPYVDDLGSVIDMQAIAESGIKIGVDPMGGSGVGYWEPIANKYGLNIEIVNRQVDPTFSFMTLDKDGKIRMDCSSPHAMASLVSLKDRFDIAVGNDPDFDRHGIVTKSGLMNPNHYLAVAISYLFQNRPDWNQETAIGKTLVSSSMIDRVAADLGRTLCEVPVGFKWFSPGLFEGTIGFGGEESAGASFLRRDGSVWTTDKDGIILALLAAEITAKTGSDPSVHYAKLEEKFGCSSYERIDAPANDAQKKALGALQADNVTSSELAGESILQKLTEAPGNGARIGGLKIVTENGWFAARPSGTEDIYKIYAESFIDRSHLEKIQSEAKAMVAEALGSE